jgi:hypothetical protein
MSEGKFGNYLLGPTNTNHYIGETTFSPKSMQHSYKILTISARLDFNRFYDKIWDSNTNIIVNFDWGATTVFRNHPSRTKYYAVCVSQELVYKDDAMEITCFCLELQKPCSNEKKIFMEYKISEIGYSSQGFGYLFREISKSRDPKCRPDIIVVNSGQDPIMGRFVISHASFEKMVLVSMSESDSFEQPRQIIHNTFYEFQHSYYNPLLNASDFASIFNTFKVCLFDDLIGISMRKITAKMCLAHALDKTSLFYNEYLPLDMLRVIVKEMLQMHNNK